MKKKAFLFIELSIAMTLCALTALSVMTWYGYVVQKYKKSSLELHALELGLWEAEDIQSNKPYSSYTKKFERYEVVCTILPCKYTIYYPVIVSVFDNLTFDDPLIVLHTGFCV